MSMKSASTDEDNSPKKMRKTRLTVAFVLATDIVEHSLKATTEQAHDVRNLIEMACGCPAYRDAAARGKVISGASGDGFLLAFFDDPIAPVHCARDLRTKVLTSSEFQIRQAIHVGPIEVIESDISGNANFAGEGANMAARALDGCPPNDIVLTERAAEFAQEDPDIADCLVPLSKITVKHGEILRLFSLSASQKADGRLSPFLAKAQLIREAAVRQGETKTASAMVIAKRLRVLRTQTIVGICAIPVAATLSYVLGATDAGTRLRLIGYEWAIGAIGSPTKENPVTFIDISNRLDKGKSGETDLTKLRALIDEIAEHAPAGIAIDIDFGYHSDLPSLDGVKGRYLDENEVVLRQARKLTNAGCPVYLSVYESLAMQDPDDWLGKGYSDLAVHPLRPDDALGGQMLMMGDLVVGRNRIPSLSAELATAYLKAHGKSRPASSAIVTPYVGSDSMSLSASGYEAGELSGARIVGERMLLNTSGLERVKDRHIDALAQAPFLIGPDLDSKLRGKAVIIGSTGVANDFFILGSSGKREAGPYFHAVAAETILSSPLLLFKGWVRYALIFLAGLILVSAVYAILKNSIARRDWLPANRVATFASLGLIFIVLLGTILIAGRFGILWVDFPIVALLLAFHWRIAKWIDYVWPRRTRVSGRAEARQ